MKHQYADCLTELWGIFVNLGYIQGVTDSWGLKIKYIDPSGCYKPYSGGDEDVVTCAQDAGGI